MDNYRESKDIFEEEFKETTKFFSKLSETLSSLGVNHKLYCDRVIYWDGPQDEVYYCFKLVFISAFQNLLYKFKENKRVNYYLETHKFKSDCIISYTFDNFKTSESDFIYKNHRLQQALLEEIAKINSSDKNRFEIRKSINRSASRPEAGSKRDRLSHYLSFSNNPHQKTKHIPKRPPPPLGGKLKPIMM